MDNCVRPAGKQEEMIIDHGNTVPVSGINGVSENTLWQVTLPLVSGGQSITYTADVLGGDGSFCPALVGTSRDERRDVLQLVQQWRRSDSGWITTRRCHAPSYIQAVADR